MISKEYENAMKWYKNILKYSWVLQNTDIESKAYDQLSFQYFYMGKIDKCHEYQSKYHSGYLEPRNSSIQSLTMLKYQNRRKGYDRKSNEINYKSAVESSNGFVTRIKEILSTEDDGKAILSLYNYNEVFKIRVQTPVHEIDNRDLPSPTTDPNERSCSKNSKRKLGIPPAHRSVNLKIPSKINRPG